MKNTFTISNIYNEEEKLGNFFKTKYFNITYSVESSCVYDNKLIIIDGYVLPKFNIDEEFQSIANHELVSKLISKYPDNWYQKIKGLFVLVVADEKKFLLLNDHLGLKNFYYKQNENEFFISNNFYKCNPKKSNINPNSFAQKALFNREVGTTTLEKEIKKSEGATIVQKDDKSFKIQKYWNPEDLQQPLNKKLTIEYFINLISKQVSQVKSLLVPKEYCITVTGGKDSRTALAALLNQKIKPFGFTYGNPNSKDAEYAQVLSKTVDIEHEVFNPPNSSNWLNSVYNQIMNQQHPWINVHRAHRVYSFQKTNEKLGENTAYFAGYMGGELLMGIYYDNLVFTEFLTNSWNNISSNKLNKYITDSYLKEDSINIVESTNEISCLKTLKKDKSLYLREFFGLFEIGAKHHSQDLNLANEFFKYPIPFFLDIDFLTALFQSKYQFKYTDNKTKNIFKRYKLYKFNLEIQHSLYAHFDNVPFAKKGNYTTKEFRRGILYWSVVKAWRYFFDNEKKKYTPSYTYDEVYKDFVINKLIHIKKDSSSIIHKFYDVKKAFDDLKNEKQIRPEKNWHRYTNIIMDYHQINKYE